MTKGYAKLYCNFCGLEHKIEITVNGDQVTVSDPYGHTTIISYPPGDIPNWNHYDDPTEAP